ncbi:MAG: transglycosylase domain-containing protein, partial [Patescibacteria group bacterium]
GIEAAAQTFFNKHARELSLDEATLLASLPQAPSYYSPFGSHLDALKARQEYALKQMFNQGYITEEQMNEAKSADVLAKISPSKENISAPHFVMYVKEYIENKYGEELVEQGGLKVYTTLDWDKQEAAEKAVREGVEKNAKAYQANNAALVAIDPKTGQILAMVGSKDYFGESYPQNCVPGKNCLFEPNVNVAIRDRQPGSSFKPFVYLKAFTKGYTPETQLWDVDTDFATDSGEYNPKNYDGNNRGLLKMKEALAMSLNVPAVKTLYLAGVKESVSLAKSMGITTLNQPDRYGLSLVLGGGEVKLLDHTNAFATLATGGIYRPKTPILKIENNQGEILEEYKQNKGERVVEEKYVAMLDYILSTNDLRAPVFGSNNPLAFSNRAVAAKTGTTNEWRDGWTMGFTPGIAVGVWTGNNNNATMASGADGVYTAAPIWRAFMDEALKNSAIEEFPRYDKDEDAPEKPILKGELEFEKDEIKVCKIPGKDDEYCLASDACPDKYKKKRKFLNAHTILYYVDKDNPRGDYPDNPEKDPQFKKWERALEKWAEKEDYEASDPPEDKCEDSDFEN